jgi:hypothetical protein
MYIDVYIYIHKYIHIHRYCTYIAANHNKNRRREKDTAQVGKYVRNRQVQGVVPVVLSLSQCKYSIKRHSRCPYFLSLLRLLDS